MKQIQDDGSSYLWFNSNYQQAKTSYHTAQLIRLMILVDKIREDQRYKKHIEKLISFLRTMQVDSDNDKINGGFYEEFYKSIFGWKKRQKLNSWGSMFAIQAISWKQNFEKNTLDSMIELLY